MVLTRFKPSRDLIKKSNKKKEKKLEVKKISKNEKTAFQDNINDLTKFVFKQVEIKRETYDKAEEISNIIGKTVPETIESFINELYEHRGILKK